MVAANGALQMSASISMVGAPGLVGLLIKAIGAPLAILIDAISYVVSAVSIGSIQQPEEARPSEEGSTWTQVLEGLKLVRDDARLVGIAGGASMLSLAMNAAFAVLMFYLATRLGLDAGVIGLVFLAFGVGGALGAVLTSPIAARFGTGRVLICAPLVGAAGLASFTVAAESGLPLPGTLTAIFAGSVVMGAGLVGFSVLAAGVRQLLAPSQARGRVLGTLRFLEWGSMPLGSVIGGVVGEVFGAAPAILASAALLAGAAAWIIATPLRGLKELPEGE
jgi:Na+/melibiose symporter-like transporter